MFRYICVITDLYFVNIYGVVMLGCVRGEAPHGSVSFKKILMLKPP